MKINWGILGAAHIAVEQVVPAMFQSSYANAMAIASRSLENAEKVARELNIPKYYGRYAALLADPEIQADYIPLPNHLHVEWAIKALRSGKHVLVEKPVALNATQAQILADEAKRHPGLRLMEAFMYKFHPQWMEVKNWVQKGTIGELRLIESSFSFFDADPKSIVNHEEFGGGSLMDVGCYPVSISRFLFDAEPRRVMAMQQYDPEFKVDLQTSGVLEFEAGTSVFFSSIRLFENQKVKLFGEKGIIEMEIPFNPPSAKPSKIILINDQGRREILIGGENQYTLQVDFFSKAILQHSELDMPFEDAVKNMIVIDAIKESARLGQKVVIP